MTAHTVIIQILEQHQRLQMNIAPDLPTLSISQDTLQQIMGHLLKNATQAAGENGRITISAQAKALAAPNGNDHEELLKFVHIAVQDSGAGIKLADRPHVFSDTPTDPISGLGSSAPALARARSLAVTHGGRLWVDGEPNGGSTFSLLFPIAAADTETPIVSNNGTA